MSESPLLDQLVAALCCMPGIGRKSAQRIAWHLLQQGRDAARHLAELLSKAMDEIGYCRQCATYSEHDLCHICRNSQRESNVVCVVESPADLYAIEETGYRGHYFVLHGLLSPLDRIGPEELGLDRLEQRMKDVDEVILAVGSTVEGNVTAHFISDMAHSWNARVTRIAQGVPMGGELEYIGKDTIMHALASRKEI
ncbi:MAG: recombination mediator RecR [Candidatus Eutrophobiaceae bacterium]